MSKRDRNYEREDEIDNTFYIPANFTDSGRVIQGMFEMRNLAEAVLFGGGIGYIFLNLTTVHIKWRLMLVALVALPIGILSLIGYHGDCMTRVIRSIFHFVKDRRLMRYRRIKVHGKTDSAKKAGAVRPGTAGTKPRRR